MPNATTWLPRDDRFGATVSDIRRSPNHLDLVPPDGRHRALYALMPGNRQRWFTWLPRLPLDMGGPVGGVGASSWWWNGPGRAAAEPYENEPWGWRTVWAPVAAEQREAA